MPVQVADPFGSFLQGRQARQDEQYGQKRNALAQMELEQAPRDIANRNALADRQQEQYSQEQVARALQQTAAAAMRIAQSANPKAELQANRDFAANLMKQHPELAQMGDEDLKQYMGWIAGEARSKLGVAPAVPIKSESIGGMTVLTQDGKYLNATAPKGQEGFTLNAGETRFGPDGKRIASVDPKPEKGPDPSFQHVVLDNGNIGAFDARTGAIRDTGQKAAATAQTQKEETKAKVIEKQNEKAYATYQAGMSGLLKGLGGASTGPIAGRMPAFTASQQIADGAVSAMAPVLKGLFRSAGEGTFTDKDQEMLLDMMPTRKDKPEARAAKLANVNAIVKAKLGMSPTNAIAPNTQGEPVQVNTPEEAMALPPGTVFITPDGRRKVR